MLDDYDKALERYPEAMERYQTAQAEYRKKAAEAKAAGKAVPQRPGPRRPERAARRRPV